MTYSPLDTQNGTIDPFPPTIVSVNDTSYEYARRYGTLEDPPDLGSIATGKLAIVGVASSPAFFKSIDILPSIGSSITQYVSVHSEPSGGGINLTNAWHFRADSTITANNSYAFYHGSSSGIGSTGPWGVFIEEPVSNYFEEITLVGKPNPIKLAGDIEPIVQIFNSQNYPKRYGLYVQSDGTFGGNLKVSGSGDIDSTLNVGGKLTVESGGCDVTGNSKITGNLQVTGPITGTASGNKTLAAFDIPHVKKKGKRIRHIVAEGPEPGIYIRGKLKDSNVIELPEYWDGLIDPETITVSLTQIGYSQDLIVDRIEWGKRIVIRSGVGANIDCYYEVWAARWLNPMNHDEKLIVVYDGESPDDYPDGNKNFLIGGWDYDKRNPQWGGA